MKQQKLIQNVGWWTAGLVFLALHCSSLGTANGQDNEANLEFLARGSRAHHDSFPFVQTRFKLTSAAAGSLEEGLAGRWLDEPMPATCDVFWAFDGENFRRDEIYPPETVARHERKQGDRIVRAYKTQRSIWNATIEICNEPGMYFYVAAKGDMSLESYQPFTIGWRDPFHTRVEIHRTREGCAVRYIGDEELGNKHFPVVEFSKRVVSGSTQLDYYWIDVQHGFLPTRIETYYDRKENLSMLTVVDQWESISGDRWMPRLYRYVNMDTSPPRCRELVLDQVDAQHPPDRAVFELQVPEGTSGYSRLRNEWFRAVTGNIALSSFESDGRLKPGQSDVGLELASHPVVSGAVTNDESLEAQSVVPRWPFALGKTGTAIWVPLICTVVLSSLVVGLILRKRKRIT